MKTAWLWIWILIAVCVSLVWPRIFPHLVSGNYAQPAGIGDMYEALTGLFTFVGFILVLFALKLQRTDFDKRAEEFEASRRTEQVQNVKGEVFQLINVWQDIIHNTAFTDDTRTSYQGRQAFNRMSSELSSHIARQKERPLTDQQLIATMYGTFYDTASAQLGSYFRLLYNIVRFVDESSLSKEEKYQLLRLLRAHLSEPEFHLLFWNGLTPYSKTFHSLIDEYDMLQHYSFDDIKPEELRLYPLTYARRANAG